MAKSPKKSLAVPDGWADVLVRTLTTVIVAFVVLNLKEWLETHEWDLPAVAIDSACVAGGIFLFNAILTAASRTARRTDNDRVIVPARQ
jgi:hypothetical protein